MIDVVGKKGKHLLLSLEYTIIVNYTFIVLSMCLFLPRKYVTSVTLQKYKQISISHSFQFEMLVRSLTGEKLNTESLLDLNPAQLSPYHSSPRSVRDARLSPTLYVCICVYLLC